MSELDKIVIRVKTAGTFPYRAASDDIKMKRLSGVISSKYPVSDIWAAMHDGHPALCFTLLSISSNFKVLVKNDEDLNALSEMLTFGTDVDDVTSAKFACFLGE